MKLRPRVRLNPRGEVSLSLIEQDVTKISPKIRLHWAMRRTDARHTLLFVYTRDVHMNIYFNEHSQERTCCVFAHANVSREKKECQKQLQNSD